MNATRELALYYHDNRDYSILAARDDMNAMHTLATHYKEQKYVYQLLKIGMQAVLL